MNTQKFENNLFELEVKTENGESLFNAETVARSLGFVETKNGKEYVRWRTVNGYLKNTFRKKLRKTILSLNQWYTNWLSKQTTL